MARPGGRVEAGQSLKTAFSATAWNRAQDAADIVLGARGGVQGGPQQGGSLPYTWCLARNNSGATVQRWGVLSITGLEIEPVEQTSGATAEFERQPVLAGNTPADGDRSWCVAVEPIPAGKIGRVAVSGVVQAKVFIEDEDDQFVKVKSSGGVLATSGDGEATILWKQVGTGSGKWALIRFGAAGLGMKLGRTASAWNKGATHNVELFPSGTQRTQLAFNSFAPVAANKWVMIARENGGDWYLIAAECE